MGLPSGSVPPTPNLRDPIFNATLLPQLALEADKLATNAFGSGELEPWHHNLPNSKLPVCSVPTYGGQFGENTSLIDTLGLRA